MPGALLLLLLLLLPGPGAEGSSSPQPGDGDREDRGLRELLAELAPPRALPGLSCQQLLPAALPGFARLPPRPRSLARAALALALSGAACAPQARAEALALRRELGPAAAAALLRGLAGLRGSPAPRALGLLLLGLARPCGTPRHPAGSAGPAPDGLRRPSCGRSARRRRDEGAGCDPPGESDAHAVLQWVPGVGAFYSLGTSIYFAFRGCGALASERALEAAEDLGYAGLAAATAGLAGPVAFGLQLGLQPGIKAGVRALYRYLTAAGEPPPVPAAHSGPVRIF